LPGHFPFRTEHADGANPDDITASFRQAGLVIDSLTLYESVHVSNLRSWNGAVF